jgi:hypothetical protein
MGDVGEAEAAELRAETLEFDHAAGLERGVADVDEPVSRLFSRGRSWEWTVRGAVAVSRSARRRCSLASSSPMMVSRSPTRLGIR